MKITFLCQHFPPETGAPQIRIYEVSQELIKQGHEVQVLTAFPHHPHGVIPEEYQGKFSMYEEIDGIPVYRSWIMPSPKGSSMIKRLLSYFSFTISSFYSLLKSQKTDVIICTSPPLFLGITGWIGSLFKRAKFVFNVADIWPESAVELGLVTNKSFIRLAEILEGFLYRRSWKIATATNGIGDYIVNKGKQRKDVFLLPNGVNTKKFQPVPKNDEFAKKLGLTDKSVFTYAGTMGHAQGLDSVLHAAAIVQTKNPNVQFLFVGDGQEKDNLISLTEELNLSNVTFYNSVPVSEMPKVFSISDFSIVSLKKLDLFKGARPSKIFPALATGTPVLYCGEGESVELIEAHNAGRIAEPENVEDIAQGVLELSSLSQVEKETYARNGRKLAEEIFSWEKITEDLIEAIKFK